MSVLARTTPSTADPRAPAAPPELSTSKVLAGAGAAATTAVVGSFFGVTGTVVGAALGSVVSTVGTALYQRSLDKVRARVRLPGGRTVPVARAVEVPAPRTADEATSARVVVRPIVPPDPGAPPAAGTRPPARRHPRRTGVLVAAAAVLAFALGLAAVSGVEWLRGSTLADGAPGTSVGRVLGGPQAEPPAAPAEVSDEPDGSDERPAPTESPDPQPTGPPDEGGGGSTTPTPDDPPTAGNPTPTAPPAPPADLFRGR